MCMNKQDFLDKISTLVDRYIEDFGSFDSNPQLCVNPATLDVTIVNGSDMLRSIDYSDEAIEEAAGAERAEAEDATDYQVRRNPDFYAVKRYLKKDADGKAVHDGDAIRSLSDVYFSES